MRVFVNSSLQFVFVKWRKIWKSGIAFLFWIIVLMCVVITQRYIWSQEKPQFPLQIYRFDCTLEYHWNMC